MANIRPSWTEALSANIVSKGHLPAGAKGRLGRWLGGQAALYSRPPVPVSLGCSLSAHLEIKEILSMLWTNASFLPFRAHRAGF